MMWTTRLIDIVARRPQNLLYHRRERDMSDVGVNNAYHNYYSILLLRLVLRK